MKHIKKLASLLLAVVMILALATTAFATGASNPTTYTITINKNSTDKAAHTYAAYQIFTGKLETVDNKDVLSDIQWGTGVTGSTVIEELNKIDGFSIPTTATAADVAKAISDKAYTTDAVGAQAVADAINAALTTTTAGTGSIAANATSGTITGLVAGYYLVKDKDAVSGEGAQTRYILEVVKNVSVTEKASVPSVEKKVKERDDGKTSNNETDWQDAADYDIGDEVPFKLTGTLPSTFADYDTYKVYKFIDTLSTGLTITDAEKNELTVKVGTQDITNLFDVTVSGQTLTVALKSGTDLKATTLKDKAGAAVTFTKDSKIVVEYKATLNNNATIGAPGNDNKVKLEFTNNPNGEQNGEKGTTPEDKVVVFTYEIKALKVAPTSDAAIDATTYAALTDEQKADYVKVGDKYQKTQALEGAGFTLYKKVNGEYTVVGEEVKNVTTFEFKGTDAGEYKLVETTVPAGYNKAADIEIKVSATYDTTADEPKLKTLEVTPDTAGFTVTTTAASATDTTHITTDGIIVGKVLNQKGSFLPSTGGIGTTIFYVTGAVLALGAGILLITKRRMRR